MQDGLEGKSPDLTSETAQERRTVPSKESIYLPDLLSCWSKVVYNVNTFTFYVCLYLWIQSFMGISQAKYCRVNEPQKMQQRFHWSEMSCVAHSPCRLLDGGHNHNRWLVEVSRKRLIPMFWSSFLLASTAVGLFLSDLTFSKGQIVLVDYSFCGIIAVAAGLVGTG